MGSTGKRVKFLQNYYSKLTLATMVAVFCLVAFIVVVLLISLHNTRTSELEGTCEDIVGEMLDCHESIWGDYYKAFVPLTEDYYVKDLQAFCQGGYSGDEIAVLQNFKKLLASICQQDKRIKGIYVRRLSDDCRYLYLDDYRQMDRVNFALGEDEELQQVSRRLVGGRMLHFTEHHSSDKRVKVYGIQSGILTGGTGNDTCEYQLTVLYDLTVFDEVLAKHNVIPEARFVLTTYSGQILYDSQGEYVYSQEIYFDDVTKITGEAEEVSLNDVTYRKYVKTSARSQCVAFCLIPQSTVTDFQFNVSTNTVILVAMAIIAVVCVAMLSVNRLTSQKFQELEKGLRQIRQNNLSYRLDVGKQEDEFARISTMFNKMCDDLEEMINKNYVYQVLQRNAEYKALQTSINPHFLYNSLEAVRENLYKDGQKDSAVMVMLLSRIFEYQIRGDSTVTIQTEQSALQNYIEFFSIRYKYAFDYNIEFTDEILDCKVPKQIFQPIMENYFVHGFRGDETDYVSIQGYLDRSEDMIHVCFCDNGRGLTEEQIAALNAGLDENVEDTFHIGLRNVNSRLKIAFGRESRVEITSNAPGPGISVSLIFGRNMKMEGDFKVN